jgi:hypothetical protein
MPTEAAVLDDTVDADKPLILLRTSNILAYALLSMSITEVTAYGAVESAKTTRLPSGDARLAWLNLERLFKPKNDVDKYELRKKFSKSEFRAEGMNPDVWFTELDMMRRQLEVDYNVTISDSEILQHIVYNLKVRQYQNTLQMIKRDLSNTNVNAILPTLEEVKRDIRQIWNQYQTGDHDKRDRRETALVMQMGKPNKFPKKFKGDCRICGKKGHKAADCWDTEKNKVNRPAKYNMTKLQTSNNYGERTNMMKCSYCGKDNHTVERCFKKKAADAKGVSERAEVALMTTDNWISVMDETEIDEEESEKALMTIEQWDSNLEENSIEFCTLSRNKDKGIECEHNKSESDPNMWIMDSGSTSHMRFSKSGMTNLVQWKAPITVGNRQVIFSEQKGTFKGQIINEKGIQFTVTMDDVLYVPELMMNLFSLTKTMRNTKIGIERVDQYLALIIDGNKLIFDKEIKGGTGTLLGVDIYPISAEGLTEQATTIISHERMHEQLGHPNKVVVMSTAKKYGIKIKPPVDMPCESCAKGKAKRKKISKLNIDNKATKKGERIFLDIASIKAKSKGGNKFWLLIMDEYTDCTWSHFIKRKSDLPGVVYQWIMRAKNDKINIENIRCDNAGENLALKKFIDDRPHLHKINFEFTAPYTPEQNGTIERKFATLFGKTRAMLNSCSLPQSLREQLWAHCGHMATLLDKILVDKPDEKSPYEKWYDKIPSWISNLRTFGEIGIVQDGNKTKIQAKLENRGFPAMFIGYPNNHSNDVFQFYNLDRGSILLSRNVVWLGKTYGDFKKLPFARRSIYTDDHLDESSSEEEDDYYDALPPLIDDNRTDYVGGVNTFNQVLDEFFIEQNLFPPTPAAPAPIDVTDDEEGTIDNVPDARYVPTTPGRVSGIDRLHYNLRTFYNPNPDAIIDDEDNDGGNDYEFGMMTLSNEQSYELAMLGSPEYNPFPISYREAMNRKDSMKWWNAMCEEFFNMHSKSVWRYVKKKDIPKGRKIIGNRWVYTQKDDGRYRARTVGKGFSQVPGKDFHENHAPVVHDTTFRFCLCQKLLFKLSSRQFDIVTAFLYGDLDEEIYMIFPDGYERYLREVRHENVSSDEYCLLLEKALYGLVQAARQWWKKMTQIMLKLGFIPSPADPCLFVKKPEKNQPPAFVILYVDDGGIIGTPSIIEEVLKALSKEFEVKDLGKMEYFVGCHIIENSKHDIIWINQPKLIKNLEENFGNLITTERVYKTPAAPKSIVMRPAPGDVLITLDEQHKYRSGVGMLMYLVKHSRPDIANAVRELTKVLDGATEAHWKAMMRIVKFVLDTRNNSLQLYPQFEKGMACLTGVSDSEFAGDRDTRRSVYGYVTYYCGAPISWKSKSGNSVTLSSTEAEYYASSEAAKELLFIYNLIESMEIKLQMPITLLVDNTGAINLANNYSTGPRTKHIDIRTHFVRDLIVNEILKILFVKSENNDADIFTKNVSEELFIRHSKKQVVELSDLEVM